MPASASNAAPSAEPRKWPNYDEGDFVPSIRDALSYHGSMYAVPFYGESSFLAYRKDLFAKAGLTMPAHPTWQQIAPMDGWTTVGSGR